MAVPASNAQPITVYRGEQPVIPFAPPSGTVSLAGKALEIYIAVGLGSTPLFTYTESSGISLTVEASGTFTWTITRAQLLTLTREGYSWELWDVTAHERLAGGVLIVNPSSRPTS